MQKAYCDICGEGVNNGAPYTHDPGLLVSYAVPSRLDFHVECLTQLLDRRRPHENPSTPGE